MGVIKNLLSTVFPTPFIAVATCACAGILCAVNISIALGVDALFQGKTVAVALASAIGSLFPVGIFAGLLTFFNTFIPNLIGVYAIIFSCLQFHPWILTLPKRRYYFYASLYGICICILSLISFALGKNDFLGSVSLFTLILLPASSISGVLVFWLCKKLLNYKLNEPETCHSEGAERAEESP
jgi:hypothetical protein